MSKFRRWWVIYIIQTIVLIFQLLYPLAFFGCLLLVTFREFQTGLYIQFLGIDCTYSALHALEYIALVILPF